jgi:hypothetical protein
MISQQRRLILICLCAVLSGCSTSDNLPLVFMQTTTVGISASATAAQAAPDLTLGYRDVDVAIVPVVAGGHSVRGVSPAGADGTPTDSPIPPVQVAATLSNAGGKSPAYTDALSVFGQFTVNTGQGSNATTPTVGLGKFFATGLAARNLASGFATWQSQGVKPPSPTPAP